VELVVLLLVVEVVVLVWARTGPAETTARKRKRITARFIVCPSRRCAYPSDGARSSEVPWL
jgi:hypothetical protein